MQDPQAGLIEVINRIVGGAGVTLIAAFVGRAMYHAGEVRAKRRPMFSKDLIWEVPIAVGMALIGEGGGVTACPFGNLWHRTDCSHRLSGAALHRGDY